MSGRNWSATTTTSHLAVQGVPASTATPVSTVQPPVTQPSSAAQKTGLALATKARLQVARLRKQDKHLKISTPINVFNLEIELKSHPDKVFVKQLIDSLRFGARIGFTGNQQSRVSPNLISSSEHPEVVSTNIAKEINLGRMAGPFLEPPLPNLQCHPVGVVPKKHSAEWRTIYHLSYPEGDSINDGIPKDPYSLKYVRVDDAIRIVQGLGPGSYMAKTDLKSAFRLIPIHPDDWNLLGVYWNSRYYVDMYLPFGLRSAPYVFNQLSEALEWALKHNYGLQNVIHILDDFFIAESSKVACLTSFCKLLKFFISVGAPVVASKTLGPSTVLEFMGIELDSLKMEARLPADKLDRLRVNA